MRKSKLTAADIEAAEIADNDRKNNRKNGYSMMDIKDRGWARLNNGAVIIWPIDKEKRRGGVVYTDLPEGHFALDLGEYGNHLFEADDFQKYLRWV